MSEHFTHHPDKHTESPETTLQLVKHLERRFQLLGENEYDRECFIYAVEELTKEFTQANSTKLRTMLLGRFFDSFYSNQKNSNYFDKFAMSPLSLNHFGHFLKHSGAYFGNNALRDTNDSGQSLVFPLGVTQYGPSTIYHVPPGAGLQTSIGKQDIIVSENFTSCRAVVGVNSKGEALLSHITNRYKEEETLHKLKEKFGDGELYYIYPMDELSPIASREEIQRQSDLIEAYETIAKRVGVTSQTYTGVTAVHPDFVNSHNIRGTVISISTTGIQLVGYDLLSLPFQRPSPSGAYTTAKHLIPKEPTRKDVSFSHS